MFGRVANAFISMFTLTVGSLGSSLSSDIVLKASPFLSIKLELVAYALYQRTKSPGGGVARSRMFATAGE